MSINIKEIFQSDNLSLSQDKINYNFDQILANGGGPQGLKGDKGTTGAIGSIGPKGNKGEVGSTGDKGSTGADGYWALESYTSGTPLDDQYTLIPKIQPTNDDEVGYKPTNLVLGVDDSSYTLDSVDKNSLISLISGNDSADWDDLIRIRIKNVDGTFNATSGIIRMIPNAGSAKLKIGTTGGTHKLQLSSSSIELTDQSDVIKLKITSDSSDADGVWNFKAGSSIVIDVASSLTNNGNSSLLGDNTIGANGKTNTISGTTTITGVVTINPTGSLTNNGNSSLLGNNTIGATGKTNTITGTTTITGAEFRINPTGASPALNKVLVAQDTNGKALWKNPTEVMGMYPIGTIVFVNPADIIDTYFSISNAINQETIGPGGNVFTSFFGRGKSGTRWGGWYLLFGQTNAWFSGTTLISYVPTNIPGSLLIGASAPDNTNLIDNEFKSSMGTQGYNPPVGYGSSYQPSLRGDYTGVPAQGIVVGPGSDTNVGDLLTAFGAQGAFYDVLDTDALIDGTGISLDDYSLHPSGPTLHALPMAVYLGRTDLIYDYSASSSGEND